MKMKNIYIIAFICSMAACSGGNDPEVPNPEPNPPSIIDKMPISLDVKQLVEVRATDTSFESGDKVGLYVVNYNGTTPGALTNSDNYVSNMRFTFSSSLWKPDAPIYWKDESTKADFYCYYPYATINNAKEYLFAVKTDQSSLANYKASDFLWGKTAGASPTSSAVSIIVHHMMSNALIEVVPGDGFTAESLAAATVIVKLVNVKTNATIAMGTGTTTATGTPGEIIPLKENDLYRALIIPQTIPDGSALVIVTVNGKDYTLTKGATFVANTKHRLTVKVSKTNSGINVGIGGWEVDGTDNGGTAE